MEDKFRPMKSERGERKAKILEEAEFKQDKQTLDWIKTQVSWADDIAYFKKSVEPVKVVKEKK